MELINLGNYTHFEGNIIAIEKVRDWFYPLIKKTLLVSVHAN